MIVLPSASAIGHDLGDSGPVPRPLDGMLLFARFAFMPNRLGYCGGDANEELLGYLRANHADPGLRRHLSAFAGALPYLELIAESNGLPDPFDARVVEAYWIGNDLLERVDWALYARRLRERLQRRAQRSVLELLVGKPRAGARAHHAFHVFDVSFRTGLPGGERALDRCRIAWGTITAVDPGAYTVSYEPIVLRDGRLALGGPQPTRVLRALDAGRVGADHVGSDCVVDDAGVGDLLAFHWGWACLRLTPRQAGALAHYTRGMMALANQTF